MKHATLIPTASQSDAIAPISSEDQSHERPALRSRPYLPALSGGSYLIVWAVGLSIWPSNLALDATGRQIAGAYRAHAGPATAQYLLVEGLASLLLGTVFMCALASQRATLRRTWTVRVLTLTAILVSLAECVLGILLVDSASRPYGTRATELFDWVNRSDGLKMVLLALAVAGLLRYVHSPSLLARSIEASGVALSVSLLISGSVYLLLANSLAWTVYVSGPLLLLWVTGLGIWTTVHARVAGVTQQRQRLSEAGSRAASDFLSDPTKIR